MTNLLDVLADTPSIQWRIARVKRIAVGPPYSVDLVMGTTAENEANISTILGAAVLGSYEPVVNEIVHVVVHARIGALVLGPARTAPPTPPVVLPELPRVSSFYGGNAPYNITSIDGNAKHNLGGTTMTNPDASRYILARGEISGWTTVGDNNVCYFAGGITGAYASINLSDHRLPENNYQTQYGAMLFTIAPKATVTFRGTASRYTVDTAVNINYLRVTIYAINWRTSGTI